MDGQFTVYNYWMRLSMMWRIMQIEESVRPKWIAASEISIILEKPNWVIVSLLIQNISTFLTSLPPPFLAPALKCFGFLLYTSAWPGRGKLIVLDFFYYLRMNLNQPTLSHCSVAFLRFLSDEHIDLLQGNDGAPGPVGNPGLQGSKVKTHTI